MSTKNLTFKERPVRKLVVGSYTIEKIVFTNVVKLRLPISIRIYLVVNVSQIVQYRKQVESQKKRRLNQLK